MTVNLEKFKTIIEKKIDEADLFGPINDVIVFLVNIKTMCHGKNRINARIVCRNNDFDVGGSTFWLQWEEIESDEDYEKRMEIYKDSINKKIIEIWTYINRHKNQLKELEAALAKIEAGKNNSLGGTTNIPDRP
ncbi:MAG: hypothetical protein WC549_01970 [Actinomycetota bacterium]